MLKSTHTTGPVTRAIRAMRANSDQPLTITSLEIAERTGKEHKNVLADIRRLLAELGLTSAEFSADLPDRYGRSQPIYRLPKRECLVLISGYSAKLRAAIVDRWLELEGEGTTMASDLQGNDIASFRIGNRTVLADTSRYRLDGERAVVLTQGGKLRVERATYDFERGSPWMGERFGWGPWRKTAISSATKGRSGLWILGAVVEAAVAACKGSAVARVN